MTQHKTSRGTRLDKTIKQKNIKQQQQQQQIGEKSIMFCLDFLIVVSFFLYVFRCEWVGFLCKRYRGERAKGVDSINQRNIEREVKENNNNNNINKNNKNNSK